MNEIEITLGVPILWPDGENIGMMDVKKIFIGSIIGGVVGLGLSYLLSCVGGG